MSTHGRPTCRQRGRRAAPVVRRSRHPRHRLPAAAHPAAAHPAPVVLVPALLARAPPGRPTRAGTCRPRPTSGGRGRTRRA